MFKKLLYIFLTVCIVFQTFSALTEYPLIPKTEEDEYMQAEISFDAYGTYDYDAERLAINVYEGDKRYNALSDGNRSSEFRFTKETRLHISKKADKQIASLYIIWEKPVGRWVLEADDHKILAGANDFIHEYVPLSSPAEDVYINVPAGAILCDVYAFTKGNLPSWVQTWLPPWDDCDLLAFPTHADDEHLFFGGMLPYYSRERGLKVQVVYFTNHWRETYRNHELLDGLWAVGVIAYPVIGPFEDLPAKNYKEAEKIHSRESAVDFQVEILRRFRPSVVIAHDLNGEYNHGMHMLCSQALTEAVIKAADPAYSPDTFALYGAWDTPKTYLHLYENNQILLDWYQPLSTFDGKTGIEIANIGFSHHKSQHSSSFTVYGKGSRFDSRLFGLYRSTVGEDVIGNDVFENIDAFY
ncbi:MAG: PIG-L family deacetylase [Clostridia bacterium]|nr:PIG-L family deacetylase [Clostridia bacterium]